MNAKVLRACLGVFKGHIVITLGARSPAERRGATANPAVSEAMKEIMGFWIQQGLAGFRVDTVPFLIEMKDDAAVEELTPHTFLKDLRSFVAIAPC